MKKLLLTLLVCAALLAALFFYPGFDVEEEEGRTVQYSMYDAVKLSTMTRGMWVE
jgi:hypothetical protein